MTKKFINPPALSRPGGYSHVAIAQGERLRLVFIAGQVALDQSGQLIGAGDLAAQTRQVYENLTHALAAAGATFADVVKLTTYVVNYQPANRETISAVRSTFVSTEQPPAATLLGVQALASPDFLIEVEAIAVVAWA